MSPRKGSDLSDGAVVCRVMAAGLLLASVACLSPACSRSCKDAVEALHDRYCGDCGVQCECDGCPEDPYCPEDLRQLAECELSCVDGVSCEAIRGEDAEASAKINACVTYCWHFIQDTAPP